ncbi:O-antigen ligase family protein [Gordonia amicalis]|uniref:O-antigen ligase family protein n=1 Tax=Gordonia amicalis TaxID=89053 RepID=A0AAE4UC99_9ACTN|nr:O-antigen ligase family protein [Gordonia amicalis]MDV6314522.1 O-antigen ligase family protein [Gordonia amicalis]UPW13460.1 O-antigen ligase family protein [Gordonia amicalis]
MPEDRRFENRQGIVSRPATVGLLLGTAAAVVAVKVPGGPWWLNLSAIIVVACAGYVILVDVRAYMDIRITTVDCLLTVFVCVRLLTDLTSSFSLGVPLPSSGMADWIVILVAYFTARATVRTTTDAVQVLRSMIIPACFVAIVAVFQLFDFAGVTEFLAENTRSGGLNVRLEKGWDEIRATSTIGHWTALGGYLVCLAGANCAVLLFEARNKRRISKIYTLTLACLVMGTLSTLTFAPIIAVLLILAITILQLRKNAGYLIGLLIGPSVLLAGAIAPRLVTRFDKQVNSENRVVSEYSWLPESVAYRMEIWLNEALPASVHRPVVGWGSGVYSRIGLDTAPTELRWMSPESEWVRTLVTGGYVLLAAQLFLIGAVIRGLYRAATTDGQGWSAPILWATVGIVLMSFVHSHFANRGVPLALWPIIGVILAIPVRSSESSDRRGRGTQIGQVVQASP